MGNCYRAQEAGFKSGEYAMAKNKEAWLDLYADDAVIQDPVGVSPLDPTGLGQRGKEAISQFWDMVIAPGEMDFQVQSTHPAGDECANVVKLTNKMPGGIEINVHMVAVYTANDEGKITSLKAYWEYAKVQEALEKLGAEQT
jgi:ketosteroid isomerase-like protein